MYSLRTSFKNIVRIFLRSIGFALVRDSDLSELRAAAVTSRDWTFILRVQEVTPLGWVAGMIGKSRAQLRQDLFVLAVLGGLENGYFVEFGATNGVDLSNTFLLEKNFGWNGILAEPGKRWRKSLSRNRSCKVDDRCVWSESGLQLSFRDVELGELSTVDEFSSSDGHAKSRSRGRIYPVATVSLLDLLRSHEAPKVIDYLSIDTEGSEYEILSAFNFSEYSFRVITVEHNFTAAREKINQLLSKRGYRRVFAEVSEWDDWYVSDELFASLQRSKNSIAADSSF